MKVLLVGAGAVGVSYGFALARGGAEVSFLVKPAYADALRGGINVYSLKRRAVRTPERFSGFGILTSADGVAAAGPWDQVWLCVSSPALGGAWLPELMQVLAPHTIVVVLQPGADDVARVEALRNGSPVVSGVITLVAYQTPLPGEPTHPPGIAVWLPPLAKLPLSGLPEAAEAVAEAIRRGGWRAKVLSGPMRHGGVVASGALLPHIAALEGAGWTIAGLGRDGWGTLAAAASREAMALIGVLRGERMPFARHFVRRPTMRAFLGMSRRAAPFDFEIYLQYHFTKVRDQTIQSLDTWIAEASKRGLPCAQMRELRRRVFGEPQD